jgi:hypothetical protein
MAKQTFRETMWFKLGESREDEGDEAPVPLPIEDRYIGSVSADDSKAFGLHTGTTEYLKVLEDAPSDDVAMTSLVKEMKVSKQRLFMVIGAGVVAACSMLAIYVG